MKTLNVVKKLSASLKIGLLFLLLSFSLVLGACSNALLDLDSTSTNNAGNSNYNQQTEDASDEQVSQDTDSSPQTSQNDNESEINSEPLTSFEDVATYIREYGKLPDNFITKKEAQALGWVASEGNLQEVAPGKSIGGDRFGNREGLLPKANGRIWYEADINYEGGRRNADRILFSNDGLIYKTTDHYKSFTDITKGDE